MSSKLFRLFYLCAVFCLIFNTVRLPVFGISPSDAFIFAALAVWVVEYTLHRGNAGWGIPSHPLWIAALLILPGGLVSSMFAVHPTTSIAITIKICFVLTIWVSMTMLMARLGGLRAVLWTFVAAAIFTSVYALIDRNLTIGPGLHVSLRSVGYWVRAMGTVGHPAELGYVTSVALPLAAALWLEDWKMRKRKPLLIGLGIGIVIIFAALFFTGTVAAWASTALSIGLMGLVWFLRAPNNVRMAIIAGIALLAGILLLYLRDPVRSAALNQMVDYNLGRATTRTGPQRFELFDEALGAVSGNPFVGAGMDQTGTGDTGLEDLVSSDHIHNVELGGWVGGGILVFLGLVWCYVVALLAGLNALRHGLYRTDWILIGLGACILGWLIYDQTQSHLYHRYTWMTLGLIFGLGYGIRFSRPTPVTLQAASISSPLASPTPPAA